MSVLRLDASDFGPPAELGPTRWYWRLTTDQGAFLADHQVDLDPGSAEFEAFAKLDHYLRWQAAPDRQLDSEAELLGRLGRWIGEQVLGPIGPKLTQHRPAVVRVPDCRATRRAPSCWPTGP
jgi:hypothetical protein